MKTKIKKKRRKTDHSLAIGLTYWLLCGLLFNGTVLKREKEIGVGTAALGFAVAGIVMPVIAVIYPIIWLDQNVRIKIKGDK